MSRSATAKCRIWRRDFNIVTIKQRLCTMFSQTWCLLPSSGPEIFKSILLEMTWRWMLRTGLFQKYWIYPNISMYFIAFKSGGRGKCLTCVKELFFVKVHVWFSDLYQLHVATVTYLKTHMHMYKSISTIRYKDLLQDYIKIRLLKEGTVVSIHVVKEYQGSRSI
jgi:hypothetical protein